MERRALSNRNVISNRRRWLALTTGLVFAFVGFLHYGSLFLILPLILIIGAIAQPRFRRVGRWMLAIGASVLTYGATFLAVPAIILIRELPVHHSNEELIFLLLCLATVTLVIWCDVELVIDARTHS